MCWFFSKINIVLLYSTDGPVYTKVKTVRILEIINNADSLQYVSKSDTALACYNFNLHQPISIIFGRDVAKKERSQMVLYSPTSPN